MLRTWIRTFVVLAGLAGASSAPADLVERKIPPPQGVGADDYAESVAISGDTLVVGASGDDGDSTPENGRAYVFQRSGGAWSLRQTLVASDGADEDRFGITVAIDGDTIAVGASGRDEGASNAGAVYVFVRNGGTWTQQQKLLASDPSAQSQLGGSVALSGDTVVAGSTLLRGTAYVFVRSAGTWTEQQKLKATDSTTHFNFAGVVAIDGDTIVAGSDDDDEKGNSAGAAYVFVRNAGVWTEQQKLTASDGAALNVFGRSVSLSGDTALIGAPSDNDRGSFSGSAYVFVRSGSTWTEQQKLLASDGRAFDRFAGAVAVDGDTALLGADGAADGTVDEAGAVYAFTRSGGVWTESRRLVAGDPEEGTGFGDAVALDGGVLVVGRLNPSKGAAYVYDDGSGGGGGGGGGGEEIAAFLRPSRVDLRLNARSPARSTFAAAGDFGTGPDPLTLAGDATLEVGGATYPLTLVSLAGGKRFRHRAGGVDLTVTPARSGSSRAQFALKVTGELSGVVDPEGQVALRLAGADFDARGTVDLAKGRFRLGTGRATLVAPAVAPTQITVKIAGGGKDTLDVLATFPTAAVTPAAASDVTIGFGTFAATVAAADFTGPTRNRYTAKTPASAPGVALVVVDHAKGTVTVKLRNVDLGTFPAGTPVPAALTLGLGGTTSSVAVRLARRGVRLAY